MSAQVGDLTPEQPVAEVHALQRLVQSNLGAVDGLDEALLGRIVLFVAQIPCGRDDDPIAGFPAGDGLGERDGAVALHGGRAQLDPGSAQRRAVEVHAAATADDGRARVLVHAGE